MEAARALYRRGPRAEELSAYGLLPEDVAQQAVAVWPEHWPALELLIAMGTQWRTGVSGATGLDYAALPAVMDLMGIARGDRRELFDALRVMERAALETMAGEADR